MLGAEKVTLVSSAYILEGPVFKQFERSLILIKNRRGPPTDTVKRALTRYTVTYSASLNIAYSRLSDSREDAKMKGTRKVGRAGTKKKEGIESL